MTDFRATRISEMVLGLEVALQVLDLLEDRLCERVGEPSSPASDTECNPLANVIWTAMRRGPGN